jgi:class 3 adenylate cyclase
LGDPVNAAARLASEATGGEVLNKEAAIDSAGIELGNLKRRELALRGREAPLTVRVARSASLAAIPAAPAR